jgi:hypothetical protein
MVCRVGPGLIDRRTVRLSQDLVIAGSLLLMMGLVVWLLAVVGRLIPRAADTATRLAALGLVMGGAVCGVLMAIVLVRAGRVPQTEDPEPVAGSPVADADPVNEGRVWWRASNSPATAWGPDTSDEWLRSLRTPQAAPQETLPPETLPPPGSHRAPAE